MMLKQERRYCSIFTVFIHNTVVVNILATELLGLMYLSGKTLFKRSVIIFYSALESVLVLTYQSAIFVMKTKDCRVIESFKAW